MWNIDYDVIDRLWHHVNDVIVKYRPKWGTKIPLNTDELRSAAPILLKIKLNIFMINIFRKFHYNPQTETTDPELAEVIKYISQRT